MGLFLIRETNGKFNFRLKADNGEVIVVSQQYKSLLTCKAGIAAVRAAALKAGVEDQTQEGYKPIPHPKFEVYLDSAGDYRFRLKAKNGQIIAASQGYKSLDSCLNGVESVRNNAPEGTEKVEEEQQ